MAPTKSNSSVVSITATTRCEEEFVRVINWCYDEALLQSVIAAGSEDGVHVIRMTSLEWDSRLHDFACQVEEKPGWTVERWPD